MFGRATRHKTSLSSFMNRCSKGDPLVEQADCMLAFASGQVFGKFSNTFVVISVVGRDQSDGPEVSKDHLTGTFLDNKR
jgi:hypothetical protein